MNSDTEQTYVDNYNQFNATYYNMKVHIFVKKK